MNFIDTARHYGTEEVIGALLQQTPRDSVILATKAHSRKGDVLLPPEDTVRSLDQSLKAMGTDCIEVFQLHSVLDYMYDHVRDNIVPALLREREKGKFGSGNPDHVDANINSILKPALPATMKARLEELFGELEGVGLDRPNRAMPT